MEQEVEVRGFGLPEGYDSCYQGAVTSWNPKTRVFSIHFPEDYLTHKSGLMLASGITMDEDRIRRYEKQVRSVAETGELYVGE